MNEAVTIALIGLGSILGVLTSAGLTSCRKRTTLQRKRTCAASHRTAILEAFHTSAIKVRKSSKSQGPGRFRNQHDLPQWASF